MKVLVTGGRNFRDYSEVGRVLLDVHEAERITEIIHGGATGADELAGRWARANAIRETVFPVTQAEWDQFRKGAGPRRNSRMVRESQPDLCVAFPGHNGTHDCVSKARAAGVRVLEVKP